MRLTSKYNLGKLYPTVASEWHPTKNEELTPYNLAPKSSRKVWWRCDQGHEWEAAISSRTSGKNCLYCSGKYPSEGYNLAIQYPNLTKEWHPTKNEQITPFEVTPGSGKKVWWQCTKNHEWRASVTGRTRGNNCPYCSNRLPSKDNNLAVLHPNVAKEWHPTLNKELTPFDVVLGSHKRVWWICDKGHEWQAVVRDRVRGSKCRQCN